MWLLLSLSALADEKSEGDLPLFADLQPVISCCPSRALISDGVMEHSEAMRACAVGESGRGHLEFTIQPDGMVSDIASLTGDTGRDVCLAEVMERFSFPAIHCTLTVRWPVVYVIGEEEEANPGR